MTKGKHWPSTATPDICSTLQYYHEIVSKPSHCGRATKSYQVGDVRRYLNQHSPENLQIPTSVAVKKIKITGDYLISRAHTESGKYDIIGNTDRSRAKSGSVQDCYYEPQPSKSEHPGLNGSDPPSPSRQQHRPRAGRPPGPLYSVATQTPSSPPHRCAHY